MLWSQSWFAGGFFWAWSTDPFDGGHCDTGFAVENKPAETIIVQYFSQGSAKRKINTNQLTYQIYDNGVLTTDWQNYSWGGTTNFQATDKVQPGEQYSISANMSAWGAVSIFINSFNTTPYTQLQFDILGSATANANVLVSVTATNGSTPMEPIIHFTPNCTLYPTQWISVTVPLIQLGLSDTNDIIQRVNFEPSSPAMYWLDNILFT